MSYLILSVVAFLASALTLFSGFGLGTILLPVFALFFPVEVAIALTAIVHLFNNIVKLFFLGRHADRSIVIRFGLPAIAAAFVGSGVLVVTQRLPPAAVYTMGGQTHEILWVKVMIAALMVAFVVVEMLPPLQNISLERKYLPLGGVLSGFFGGLSGHQGALRSAFLIKCGLSKESFIATGVVTACLVDFSRLAVYFVYLRRVDLAQHGAALAVAGLSAFAGVYAGSRIMPKMTIKTVQYLVFGMISVMAVLLGLGII